MKKNKLKIPLYIVERLIRARNVLATDEYKLVLLDNKVLSEKERIKLVQKDLEVILKWSGSSWAQKRLK